ncbi:5433_t:CDS:2, partial [Entrophospora sp. SA101]
MKRSATDELKKEVLMLKFKLSVTSLNLLSKSRILRDLPTNILSLSVIPISSPYEDEPLQEVYTRFSRQQYERRRETFEDWYPHRIQRAQAKLAQGQPLTRQEKELLGLIKKRPGAYKSELGRAMTPAERQRARRAKLK